jgi:hypothetical protein
VNNEHHTVISEADLHQAASYPSGSSFGLFFDPSLPTGEQPQPLASDEAFLYPLRDGLLGLGLQRRDIHAAPGFHLLQTHPALLLAGWLWGASYLHLDVAQIEQQPEVLSAYPLRAVGISERVRNLLLQQRIAIGERWHGWYRDPGQSPNLTRWQQFIEQAGLSSALAYNLRWQAPRGGCTLFSAKIPGSVHSQVLPAAGALWNLSHPQSPGVPAVSDHGIFTLRPLVAQEPAVALTPSLLYKNHHSDYVYGGSWVTQSKGGLYYPTQEVLEALKDIRGLRGMLLCAVPTTGAEMQGRWTLIVFTGADGGSVARERALHAEIRQQISEGLGPEFLPSQIQLFPLEPRRNAEGLLDQNWCRQRYLSGQLFRQSRNKIYRTLSFLRQHIFEGPMGRSAPEALSKAQGASRPTAPPSGGSIKKARSQEP